MNFNKLFELRNKISFILEYFHVLILTKTVNAIPNLHLYMRIPMQIHQEQIIGTDEIQANTAGSQREQHDFDA